jgi:DNA repair protein RadC
MNLYDHSKQLQLPFIDAVKEKKITSAKRVNIVSLKLVKESSLLYQKRSIRSPQEGYEFIKAFLEDKDREYFIVVSLDTKNQPTNINITSIGTLNSALIHPREIYKAAIVGNACSIMCFHNHPSGVATESREDVDVTKRLVESGRILGIDVIDHIIIGDGSYTSLKEKGYI